MIRFRQSSKSHIRVNITKRQSIDTRIQTTEKKDKKTVKYMEKNMRNTLIVQTISISLLYNIVSLDIKTLKSYVLSLFAVFCQLIAPKNYELLLSQPFSREIITPMDVLPECWHLIKNRFFPYYSSIIHFLFSYEMLVTVLSYHL